MLDQLARIALGWLGWTEDQLLSADMNSILVALSGRKEMLRYIFGGEDDTPPEHAPSRAMLTPDIFDREFSSEGLTDG